MPPAEVDEHVAHVPARSGLFGREGDRGALRTVERGDEVAQFVAVVGYQRRELETDRAPLPRGFERLREPDRRGLVGEAGGAVEPLPERSDPLRASGQDRHRQRDRNQRDRARCR